MKKIIFLLGVLLLSELNSFSQNLEDVGAGVIDFLLRNPKTANRMNTSEEVALDIIGDLLKTSSNRKHELKYAEAGSNKVVINSGGRNAEIVRDLNGKIYLLVDGIIYPISDELIQQAQNSQKVTYSSNVANNDYLTPYNIDELKRLDKNRSNNDDEICAVFTCNNVIHNKSVMNIKKDFQNIKKQFYKNENIYVVIRYNTNKNKNYYSKILVMRIFDSNNNLVLERTTNTSPNKNYYIWWTLLNFSPGIYTIHAVLCNSTNEYIPLGQKHKVVKMKIL